MKKRILACVMIIATISMLMIGCTSVNGTDCVTKLFHQDGSIVSFECRMCGCVFETDVYSIRAFSNPVFRESVCPQCLSTTKKLGAIG